MPGPRIDVSWSGEPRHAPALEAPTQDADTLEYLKSWFAQQPGLLDRLAGKGLELQSMFRSPPPAAPPRQRRGDVELPAPKGSIAALRRKTQ